MGNKNRYLRIKKRKACSFNPGHEFISGAVEEFLKGGGKITHLQPDDKSYRDSMNLHGWEDIDDFLRDQ